MDRRMSTTEDDQAWEDLVAYTRREIVAKIADSAFVMSLVPSAGSDIKFAIELGTAIMLDKPIVALAIRGRDIPPGLRRVAHAVIEIGDIDTEAGQMELRRKLEPVMAELGIGTTPEPEDWCAVDDCPAAICGGPHRSHVCTNGDTITWHPDHHNGCPVCGQPA